MGRMGLVRPRDCLPRSLGQLDADGAAVVVPALTRALATGTPLLLALDAVPAALRDINVSSGCAADYDAWLLGGAA